MKRLPFKDTRIKLFLLSVAHFATDALCSYLVFTRLYPKNPSFSFAVFIGYNLLAFVAQAPIGILIDRYGNRNVLFVASAAAIFLGYLFSSLFPIAVLFIGTGNALFHVAGGKYVTDKSGNNVSHLGVFVSTGAIGLALGQGITTHHTFAYLCFALLFGCTLIMLLSKDPESKKYTEEYKSTRNGAMLALLAVAAVVFVRSFAGKISVADFETTQLLVLIVAFATALGKVMGGVASRLFGTVPTVVASMSVAAVCLTLGSANPYAYILGVFAFNFSMPITLYYANIIAKGKEGFAFGVLAAILLPGYLIAMIVPPSIWTKVLTAVLCLFSALVIVVVSKRIKKC